MKSSSHSIKDNIRVTLNKHNKNRIKNNHIEIYNKTLNDKLG